MIETILAVFGFVWKIINEGLFSKIKRLANWIRNSPIKLDSLILYMAIDSVKNSKFNNFCDMLKSAYNFKIDEVTSDNILTHIRTLVVSKNGIQLKVYLVSTPSISLSVRNSNMLKVELMSQTISYREGINNLKLLLGELVTCSRIILNSKAKFTYKMPLKNIKKVNLKETSYKIQIYGDRAIVESNNIDNLQKVIALNIL